MDLIGAPLDRVDGRLKVSGAAKYAAEYSLPNLAHAHVVQSSIARGRIREIDTSAAISIPGVLDVITHRNAPKLYPIQSNPSSRPGQTYLVLQDDQIRYYGQHIAIVVAESVEQAQHGAESMRIEYFEEEADTDLIHAHNQIFKPKRITTINAPPVDSSRGDVRGGLRQASAKLDLTFTTAIENHNALEPHATIASWDGDELTLIDSTQWVIGTRNLVATNLGIAPERVRVISPFVGGGFGSKGNPWPHPTLAAVAARHVNRPVKLVLSREHMFSQVGHRPATIQQMELGADQDGRLTAISDRVTSGTSQFDDYVEAAGTTARVAYSCANVETTHRLVRLDVNTPCPMRAPGEAVGNFSIECAMDELAYATGLDPLEIRIRNYADRDEDRDKPFSSKSLRGCYAVAAERFGWRSRPSASGSMKAGNLKIGWGMASAIFTAKLSKASARVTLEPDGSVIVSTASHDIGTGTYTSLAQVAADELRVPVSRIRVNLADTFLPEAPASAGSQTSGSVGSAIVLACRDALRRAQTSVPGEPIEAEATWTPADIQERAWSSYSFGAHFCEVAVDEDLGSIKVRRWMAAFAAGRILNEKTARSQLVGGIVWGIGQALLERTIYDSSSRIVNRNLADYLVPVNADVPPIEVILIPEADTLVNPAGAKGLGELGICGAAAAIANATFHATGIRVRDLPITHERIRSVRLFPVS